MYKLLRTILFRFDPERVHYFSMHGLRRLCKISFVKKWMLGKFAPRTNNFPFQIFGLNFKNRVGLGAGFDKNAEYLTELEALGFGFIEIGTVTPRPQPGNDKPRVFRLPKDKALVNRMGFNNDGVEVIAKRLSEWRAANQQLSANNQQLIIGGNIGKNKSTPNKDAWKDYEICFMALHDHVDYFVVNVSSPNTPGLRELQEKEALAMILKNLQRINKEKPQQKPILLKIAPDLTTQQIDDVINLALEIQLDGLVATNTTIVRKLPNTSYKILERLGPGGLSGLPLKTKSTEIIQYIFEKTRGKIPVIASGGIFTGADAKEKINAGAGLVQVWTGFIYEGPAIVKNICKEINKIN